MTVSALALNPCIRCGACCAYFRASFYWAEAAPETGGTVPPEMTEPLTPTRVVMKGTNSSKPRCACLVGNIGEQVHCAIYPQRSSVCRDFEYSWQNGQANERCDRARAAWGLPPIPAPNPAETDRPLTPEVA